MSTVSVILFPEQSKPAPKPQKRKPGKKSTVLEWIRSGYVFPGKPAPSDKGGGQ